MILRNYFLGHLNLISGQTHNATIINSKPPNEVRKYDGTLGYYFAQSPIVYGNILCFLDGRE